MKKLFVLSLLTMLFIACQSDQPLTPTEEITLTTEDETFPPALAPVEHKKTTILQLVPAEDLFLAQFADDNPFMMPNEDVHGVWEVPLEITPIGAPTQVYIVLQGKLTKVIQTFEKEIYQFIWCYLDGEVVLVNILKITNIMVKNNGIICL